MTESWKNSRTVIGGPSELTQVRLSLDIKARAKRLAKKKGNNSSLSAMLRVGLEELVEREEAAEAAKTGKSGALFD